MSNDQNQKDLSPRSMTGARVDAAAQELRAKIGNKFQAATFMGGLSAAVIGIQLTILVPSGAPGGSRTLAAPPLLPASMLLMLAALFLFIYGARRLDALTMPKMFWGETPYLGKDPRRSRTTPLTPLVITLGDLQALWERMKMHWIYLVGGATWSAFVSLILMVVPIFAPKAWLSYLTSSEGLSYPTGGAVLIPLVYLLWFRLFKDRKPLSHD